MFKVCKEQCDQCLFSKNKIVTNARRKDILRQAREQDSHFVCHKSTLANNGEVCCKGFYDANPFATNLMRIAHRLSMIVFVEIPQPKE